MPLRSSTPVTGWVFELFPMERLSLFHVEKKKERENKQLVIGRADHGLDYQVLFKILPLFPGLTTNLYLCFHWPRI